MLIRRTIRGPVTASFRMAVRTVLPSHATSRGPPTLTDRSRAVIRPASTQRCDNASTETLALALGARAVEHDLVLGDLERDALGDAVDRRLELGVGERDHLAAAGAHHVVMMVRAGTVGLVARDALADLDLRHEAEPVELVEDAIDARARDAAPALAQLRLDLVRGQRARLVLEQADDRRASAAAPEAGLLQPRLGEIGPSFGGLRHRETAYLRFRARRPAHPDRRLAAGGRVAGVAARRARPRAEPAAVPRPRDGDRHRRPGMDRLQRLRAGADDRDRRARPDPLRGRADVRPVRDPSGAPDGGLACGGGDRRDSDRHGAGRLLAVRPHDARGPAARRGSRVD